MAECGRFIQRHTVAYPCEVEIEAGQTNNEGGKHRGPCMSRDIPATVRERERWSFENSGLGEFHGQPETTAERYTENPTPVPQTAAERLERQQAEERERRAQVNAQIERDRILAYGSTPQYPYPTPQTAEIEERAEAEGRGRPSNGGTTVSQPPTRTRPEDQPLPEKNDQQFIQERVMDDIRARMLIGIERYGTPLQPFNGRNAVKDAYEESIDLTQYLKQMLVEREELAAIISELRPMVGMSQRGNEILDRLEGFFGVNAPAPVPQG